MKIFKDIISKEEMFSDQFPIKEEYNSVIYKIQSTYKNQDKIGPLFGIDDNNTCEEGREDYDQEPSEKVIDVVYNTGLEKFSMNKKEFMNYLKRFFAKVVKYLNDKGKAERVEGFKKGATEFVKFIIGKFDDIEVYVPKTKTEEDVEEIDFGVAISYWEKEDDKGPVFYFFKDALVEEKC